LAGDPVGGNGNAGIASVLSGNTVNAPISAPINVCASRSGCSASPTPAAPGGATTIYTPPPPSHPHPGPRPTWTLTGSGSGATTSTVPGGLPITGANLLGMLAAALVSVGVGSAW
jgi:ChpA-C